MVAIYVVQAPTLLPSTREKPFYVTARDADDAIRQVVRHMWGSPADYTATLRDSQDQAS